MTPLRLTNRERDILEYTADGLSTLQISREFNVGMQTIKWHKSNLFRKLRATNAPHAISIAYQKGLLQVQQTGPREIHVDGVLYIEDKEN